MKMSDYLPFFKIISYGSINEEIINFEGKIIVLGIESDFFL